VSKLLNGIGGNLERHAGFAGAARADKRQQAAGWGLQLGTDSSQVGCAANKGRGLRGQVVGMGREGAQRRKFLIGQIWMIKLKDGLRLGQVFQQVHSQVDQFGAGGQGGLLGGLGTEQNLPAPTGAKQALGTADFEAEKVISAGNDCASM